FSSRRVFRVRRTEHRRAYPSTTRWGGRVDGTVPHSAAPPCVAAPGSAPTSPPGPDTPTHSPRSHPLPVDIGGTERRVSPRSLAAPATAPWPAPSRSPGPLPNARPAPTRRPIPPITSAAGRYRRNGAARLATMPWPRPVTAPWPRPAGPAARAQQRAPRLASLCASPPRSVPPGVGAEREGALGAASALDGVIGHD